MSMSDPTRPAPTSLPPEVPPVMAPPVLPPGPLAECWRGFSANRGALVALVVFTLLALAALLAPWIAPHDPVRQYREAC